MNVTEQLRRLEGLGFSGALLDRAVAAAGARRLDYQALCASVENGASPEAALAALEGSRENGCAG